MILARQWSLRRSTPVAAGAEGGLPRVQECFRLHLNAVGSGVAIVQVCVVDHTDNNYRPPHLHLQLLFSDSSRSQWIQLNQVTVPQLQTALAELVVPPSQPQPQLHLHEVEPLHQGVDRAVQDRLPRHELTAAEAVLWAQRGRQCPICLAHGASGKKGAMAAHTRARRPFKPPAGRRQNEAPSRPVGPGPRSAIRAAIPRPLHCAPPSTSHPPFAPTPYPVTGRRITRRAT